MSNIGYWDRFYFKGYLLLSVTTIIYDFTIQSISIAKKERLSDYQLTCFDKFLAYFRRRY